MHNGGRRNQGLLKAAGFISRHIGCSGLAPENRNRDVDEGHAAHCMGDTGRNFLAVLHLLAANESCDQDDDCNQRLDTNLHVVWRTVAGLENADHGQTRDQLHDGAVPLPDRDRRSLEIGQPAE
mgnify:CR=1 FL=1